MHKCALCCANFVKLVIDPDGFFAELCKSEPRLRKPALIVLAVAIMYSVSQYVIISKISEALPGEISQFFVTGAYVGIAISFVATFAVWGILAVIMHGLSAFFGGKGQFKRTFEFVGYGFLPTLVNLLITTPITMFHVLNVKLPKVSLAQLMQNPDIVKMLILALIPRDIVFMNVTVSIVFTVWSVLIWSFAVKNARNIPLRKAVICVIIPTAIFMAYQIFTTTRLLQLA